LERNPVCSTQEPSRPSGFLHKKCPPRRLFLKATLTLVPLRKTKSSSRATFLQIIAPIPCTIKIRRVLQVPGEVKTTTEDGCPRCLAIGIWESTDLGPGKLRRLSPLIIAPTPRTIKISGPRSQEWGPFVPPRRGPPSFFGKDSLFVRFLFYKALNNNTLLALR
jgi:hypothetical protein